VASRGLGSAGAHRGAGHAVDYGASRSTLHMRDYASFAGWHDDLLAYAGIRAESLDAGGQPAIRCRRRRGEDPPDRP
jgi:hypothetical protein